MTRTSGALVWNELVTPYVGGAKPYDAQAAGWRFDAVDMGVGPYDIART